MEKKDNRRPEIRLTGIEPIRQMALMAAE